MLGVSGANSVPGQQQGAGGNQVILGTHSPIHSLAGQQTPMGRSVAWRFTPSHQQIPTHPGPTQDSGDR